MAAVTESKKACAVNPLKMSQPLGASYAFMGLDRCMPVMHGSQGCTSFGLVLLVWITMAVVFRYSSLAALTASLAAPVIQAWGWGLGPATVGTAIMSALLIWRHEANIRKLLAGQESKLGQKAPGATGQESPKG